MTVRKNKVIRFDSYKVVLLNTDTAPHTFLNYIFVNNKEYVEKKYPSLIIEHEIAHIQQRHTVDRIVVELIQVIFWFNPMLMFYKRSLKIIHEYLADNSVLGTFPDVRHYKETLINQSHISKPLILSSHSNYSLTKKRIMMMNSNKSMQYSKFKIAVIIPVAALLIVGLNLKASVNNVTFPNQEKTIEGSVKDANTNQPLSGVSVIIKDKHVGTITDLSGNYLIKIEDDEDKVLMFLHKGYNTAYMPVLPSERIDVLMEKIDVNEEQSVIRAVTRNEYNSENISIRSKDGGHPLFIVEGKRISEADFKNINPDEIKSISVLRPLDGNPQIIMKYASIIDKYPDEAEFGIVDISLKKKE